MTIAESLKEEGRELGFQQGIEKGRFEARLDIARTLLANGLDQATVMNATGLTADDLAQLHH